MDGDAGFGVAPSRDVAVDGVGRGSSRAASWAAAATARRSEEWRSPRCRRAAPLVHRLVRESAARAPNRWPPGPARLVDAPTASRKPSSLRSRTARPFNQTVPRAAGPAQPDRRRCPLDDVAAPVAAGLVRGQRPHQEWVPPSGSSARQSAVLSSGAGRRAMAGIKRARTRDGGIVGRWRRARREAPGKRLRRPREAPSAQPQQERVLAKCVTSCDAAQTISASELMKNEGSEPSRFRYPLVRDTRQRTHSHIINDFLDSAGRKRQLKLSDRRRSAQRPRPRWSVTERASDSGVRVTPRSAKSCRKVGRRTPGEAISSTCGNAVNVHARGGYVVVALQDDEGRHRHLRDRYRNRTRGRPARVRTVGQADARWRRYEGTGIACPGAIIKSNCMAPAFDSRAVWGGQNATFKLVDRTMLRPAAPVDDLLKAESSNVTSLRSVAAKRD